MTALLLAVASRVWRWLVPPVPGVAEFEAEKAAASRAMSEAVCLTVVTAEENDPYVKSLFLAMVPRMRMPHQRKGGA